MVRHIFWAVPILVVVVSRTASQSQFIESNKDKSSITYLLVHPLHKIEATSKDVLFKAEIDPVKKEIKSVTAEVDVTTFDSGNSNRDSHAMEVIDAITYPLVTFTSTSVTPSGDSLAVEGKLVFHGVTKTITATVIPSWQQQALSVQGNFGLSLTAFNIERPSLLLIPVNDTLKFSLTAVFEWK